MARQREAGRVFQSQNRMVSQSIDDSANQQKMSILEGLGRFAQAGSAEYSRQQAVEIESEKAEGASRAAKDLLVANDARAGITEDDTLAAKLSYNAIIGQNDTIKAGNSFAEWYQGNPDADEDTISAKKKELYEPLFEKFGDDKRSMKQISLQVQQSQFNLAGVQDKIKKEYTKQKGVEALDISLDNQLSDPNADLDAIVDEEIGEQAKSLNLDEFELKTSLMKTAAKRAGEGDARLLNKLKTLPWAKKSAALEKAQSDYENFVAREQAPAIGNVMGDIALENISLAVPWETTLRKTERMNKAYPNTYSKEKVESLKKARATAAAKQAKMTTMVQRGNKALTDSNAWPLGIDPSLTDKEKKDAAKNQEEQGVLRVQELESAGHDSDVARAQVLKEQLNWSRANRLPIEGLKTAVETTLNFNLDEMTDDKMPNYAVAGLNILKTMDSTALDMYVSKGPDMALAMNFRMFAQTSESDEQAYRRAMRVKQNPFSVKPEMRGEQEGRLSTEIEDVFTNSTWENFWRSGDVEKDVPEFQRKLLTSQLSSSAITELYAGSLDTEGNAKKVVKNFMARSTQIGNGTITNQSRVDLHKNISAGRDMPIEDVGKFIDAELERMLPVVADAVRMDLDPSRVVVDFSRDGRTYTLLYDGQEQLGGTFMTKDIYDAGVLKQTKELEDLQAAGRESADIKNAVRTPRSL